MNWSEKIEKKNREFIFPDFSTVYTFQINRKSVNSAVHKQVIDPAHKTGFTDNMPVNKILFPENTTIKTLAYFNATTPHVAKWSFVSC